MWLLDKMLRKLVKKGELTVTDHDGKVYRYGAPDPNFKTIRIRLTDKGAAWHIAKDPRVGTGDRAADAHAEHDGLDGGGLVRVRRDPPGAGRLQPE